MATKDSNTKQTSDKKYFRELLNIVTRLGGSGECGAVLSTDYWRDAIDSCDLVWRDHRLHIYLGTLDAAVDCETLFALTGRCNVPYTCIDPEDFSGSSAMDNPDQIEPLVAEINRAVKTPPSPLSVDGIPVGAGKDGTGGEHNAISTDGAEKGVSTDGADADTHRSVGTTSTSSGQDTTKDGGNILPRLCVVNACAFDKHFARTNRLLVPVERTEAYIADTELYYRKEWTKRNGREKQRAKVPRYLELKAVDKDSYDIGRLFDGVRSFVSSSMVSSGAPSIPRHAIGPSALPVPSSSTGASDTIVFGPSVAPPCVFYVRCVVGSNRSSALVCAILVRFRGWTAKEAVSVVASRRRCRILTNKVFIRALIAWEKHLRNRRGTAEDF